MAIKKILFNDFVAAKSKTRGKNILTETPTLKKVTVVFISSDEWLLCRGLVVTISVHSNTYILFETSLHKTLRDFRWKMLVMNYSHDECAR